MSERWPSAVGLASRVTASSSLSLGLWRRSWFGWRRKPVCYHTAIFRQVNREVLNAHHDALEFPDGHVMLLTLVAPNQKATVLQLPATPKSAAEADAQRRVAYVG